MALTKQKSKRAIANDAVFCRSAFSKMRGLMFARDDGNRALIMVFDEELFVPLHMLFVFFPIDIIYLDKDKNVVELFRGAKPFISYIRPKRKARYVIELSAGKIKENNIRIGDKLSF